MQIPELEGARPIVLGEMLDARERRAMQQQVMLERNQCTLVCFTLNLPGAYKQFPLALQAFREGLRLILRRLGKIREQVVWEEATGSVAFLAVEQEAAKVKEAVIALEESVALGRLFDIDVLDKMGQGQSRSSMGYRQRRCLLCSRPAAECGRARSHPVEDVFLAAVTIMHDYFSAKYADQIAATATRALLYEVAATPKPGLVDRANNGAHSDMDFYTFLNSASALAPYFRQAALAGAEGGTDASVLFRALRHQGRLADEEMLAATGGVNTHRGLVFSMGVLCGAAGQLYREDQARQVDILLQRAAKLASFALEDLKHVSGTTAGTHGERVYAAHGMGGVRREAADGFPNAVRYGLPVLCKLTGEGYSLNDAVVCALLQLMAHVEDTNVVHRGGEESLVEVQARVKAFLRGNPGPQQQIDFLTLLDEEFIRRNISPGGCADLLAVTCFLYLYEQEGRAE